MNQNIKMNQTWMKALKECLSPDNFKRLLGLAIIYMGLPGAIKDEDLNLLVECIARGSRKESCIVFIKGVVVHPSENLTQDQIKWWLTKAPNVYLVSNEQEREELFDMGWKVLIEFTLKKHHVWDLGEKIINDQVKQYALENKNTELTESNKELEQDNEWIKISHQLEIDAIKNDHEETLEAITREYQTELLNKDNRILELETLVKEMSDSGNEFKRTHPTQERIAGVLKVSQSTVSRGFSSKPKLKSVTPPDGIYKLV